MLKHIDAPLVSGFLLGKQSLDFVEFFQPTTDKIFGSSVKFMGDIWLRKFAEYMI
jgi:hypothetical protein